MVPDLTRDKERQSRVEQANKDTEEGNSTMSTEGNTGNGEGRTGQQQSQGNCNSATESAEQGIPIPTSSKVP